MIGSTDMHTEADLQLAFPGLGAELDKATTRPALDELFHLTYRYKSSQEYSDLLRFIARFRFYAPFNAMLVHMQMPGARFVAPPYRWLREYSRRIKPGARPIVILQPMGPVMFVFDVSDTEPEKDAPPLPREVENPFEVRSGKVGGELVRTIENAQRDGVRISMRDAGSQSAGEIGPAKASGSLKVLTRLKPKPTHVSAPLRYELLLNSRHSAAARYATLAHELAHLYCGHLGTPNPKWWTDRSPSVAIDPLTPWR